LNKQIHNIIKKKKKSKIAANNRRPKKSTPKHPLKTAPKVKIKAKVRRMDRVEDWMIGTKEK